MKKLSKRFLSIFLALLMLVSVMPAGMITAQAAETKELAVDMGKINSIGAQPWGSICCTAYCVAYCRTMLDGNVANWKNYWTTSSPTYGIVNWSLGGMRGDYPNNANVALQIIYDSINRGRPAIVKVAGIGDNHPSHHYITIIGYKNITDRDHLAFSNFICLDSNPGSYGKYQIGGAYNLKMEDKCYQVMTPNSGSVMMINFYDKNTAIFDEYQSKTKTKYTFGRVKIHYDGFGNWGSSKVKSAYGRITFTDICHYRVSHKGAPQFGNYYGKKILYFQLSEDGRMLISQYNLDNNHQIVNPGVQAYAHFKNGKGFDSPHNLEKIDTLKYNYSIAPGFWSFSNQYKDGDNRVYFKYAGEAINGVGNYNGTSTVAASVDLNTYKYAETNKQSTSNIALSAVKNIFLITAFATTGSFTKAKTIIPAGTYLKIYDYNGDYGKTYYGGQELWVNLNYCYYVAPAIMPPPAPTVTLNSAQDICEGDFINVSWNNVTDAEYYVAKLYNSKDTCIKTIDRIYGTNASFQAIDPETYTVKVYGKNYMFDGDVGTCAKKVTVHKPSKVTYLNDDRSFLMEQTVPYKNNASAPIAPEKAGYTFRNWIDESSDPENGKIITPNLTNIQKDTTVIAYYEKNKYKVHFVDSTGNLVGDEQLVEYGKDAELPDESKVVVPNSNYEFAGWDSEKYKNVYNLDKNEPIVICAIYNWINKDLPIACSNVSAARQPDGYTVTFDLENYPDARTRGRAVVALKTNGGKLVYTTESAAFSIAEGGHKTMEVFVPCDYAATVAEAYIIDSSYDGIPISNNASSSIDSALMWSNWMDELPKKVDPNDPDNIIETRLEYRYRDKEKITNFTNSKEGYIWSGTDPVKDAVEDSNSPGAWNAWTWTKQYPDDKRVAGTGEWKEVQQQDNVVKTAAKYSYYYYRYWNSSAGCYYYTYSSGMGGNYYSYSQSSPLTYYATYDGVNAYVRSGNPVNFSGELWFQNGYTAEVKASRWRNRVHKYHYNLWRWKDWTDWSTEEVSANDDREVETKTTTRYQSVSAGIEDDSGESHTFEGEVEEELAGKNITLFITKYKASSDFTNEFVGQSTVRDDGSYSFTYKLREEPSADTGDFTIKIGIEGETGTREVGIIEAPKAQYEVVFYDGDGHIINTQTVTEGENAVMPEAPESEGKTFVCWNNSCTNVRGNLEVSPVYTDNVYTVAFVNWRTQDIELKEFKYGERLVAPTEKDIVINEEDQEEVVVDVEKTIEDTESGKPLGWDILLENNDEQVLVTSNMVVQAVYETNEYTVEFKDAKGNTVETRTVEYGDSITVEEMPDLPEDEYAEYYDWAIEPEKLMNIKENIVVPAVFEFDETTPTPIADVTTGYYDGTQTVTLSCEDESATIFYTTDGSDPTEIENENGGNAEDDTIGSSVHEYSVPIEISADTELRFYASSLGKNDSEEATEYYAFGSSKIVNVYNNFAENSENSLAATFISDDISATDNELFTVDGFTLNGVYTDSEYNNLADFENGTFGNVVNLYAKYSINSYTVTFKKDGETVYEQTVDYGGEATPPEMPKDGTKVFYEWDTDEYTFVEKDLTVNAVYKEESEITKITLNRDNYTMDQGDTFMLEGEISGVDLPDDISIIWHSEDENVATVYDDGTVTANGSGETIIYGVASDDSAVAECRITVNPSVNYSVTLRDSAAIRFDSAGYLRNIPINNNTVDSILVNFKNSPSSLEFKNANGEAISGESLVGTGTTISLLNNGSAVHSIIAVMTGDITCDGKINNRDVVYAARVIVKKQTADEPQLLAMDANGDGKVNNRDVAMLARYLVGKETIA